MTAFTVVSRVAAVAALVVLALAVAVANAQSQTCASTANPLTSLSYTDPNIEACVRARCIATVGTVPSIRTDGYCNGVATSESTTKCPELFAAYNEYYACIMRGVAASTDATLADVTSEAKMFMSTPGYPYHLSPLGCYACNHFRDTVFPTLGSDCTTWTCSDISSQNPASLWYGVPGKGYNHQLCGTGCIAVMLLTIPFALVSASMFIVCGCCWPSPSLKTTYLEVQKEEEAEKHRARSDDEDDEEDQGPHPPADAQNNSVAHEPVVANENNNHPEERSNPEEYVNLR